MTPRARFSRGAGNAEMYITVLRAHYVGHD